MKPFIKSLNRIITGAKARREGTKRDLGQFTKFMGDEETDRSVVLSFPEAQPDELSEIIRVVQIPARRRGSLGINIKWIQYLRLRT